MKLPLACGCLCGAIRYRMSTEPRRADYCHCSMCRRAAGAPVVARLTVANESFAWTAGEHAVYHSSPEAERLFCPKCGTQLALRDEPEHLYVTLSHPSTLPRPSTRAIISGPRTESAGSIPQTTCHAIPARERLRGDHAPASKPR
jgi:hypothetical protein